MPESSAKDQDATARATSGLTSGAELQRWRRRSKRLVIATMIYNSLEAVLAVGAGLAASSIALVGFGLDSVIELTAASALLWRLRVEQTGADAEEVERRERLVQRIVGATFLALALYVTVQAGLLLWQRASPEESTLGIILAVASLTVMPLVAWGKLVAARHLGSRSLAAEARETLACSYLSLTLLIGLVANAAWGLPWADPAAALLMVPWLVREGLEGLRGEDED